MQHTHVLNKSMFGFIFEGRRLAGSGDIQMNTDGSRSNRNEGGLSCGENRMHYWGVSSPGEKGYMQHCYIHFP